MSGKKLGRTRGRRDFLRAGLGIAGSAFASGLGGPAAFSADGVRPKVAAVVTELRFRDHAHVILENFLEPYLFNGKRTDPGFEVAGLYIDQPAADDMARDVAGSYAIPIFPTIAGALCLGGERLAVDAVLSIGEHG